MVAFVRTAFFRSACTAQEKLTTEQLSMQKKNNAGAIFFARLRETIERYPLKQKILAEKIGVSESTLSRYRTGTQRPSGKTLQKLAEIAGVSFSWLCGEKKLCMKNHKSTGEEASESMQDVKNYPQRLRMALKASGVKQKDLARKIGVSSVTMSRYSVGERIPPAKTMLLIAQELGLPLSWFYEDSEPPKNCEGAPTNERGDEIDWRNRALMAEERLDRLESILRELFAFARIGR